MQFNIISRHQSRRTQYNKRDLHNRLRMAGYHFVEDGVFTKVQVATVEERKDLEYHLHLVHRNIFYRIEV